MKRLTKTVFLLFTLFAFLSVERQSAAQTFTTLYTFSAISSLGDNSDGANPQAGLLLSGNTLYGTTEYGGNAGNGTVFTIETNGMNFTPIHTFSALVPYTYTETNYPYEQITGYTNGDGIGPETGLILSGTILYGTASSGGFLAASNLDEGSALGTVFAINMQNNDFTTLHSFQGDDGDYTYGALVLSGTNLYGTTAYLGAYGYGTLFAVNTDGTVFTNLYSFTGGNDGGAPGGGLVSSGTNLYGITGLFGAYGYGTVFTINTDGTVFTNLYSFTGGIDGGYPGLGLILSGTNLYGTTRIGGANSAGTVFAINTDGTVFTNLHSFAPLVLDDDTNSVLYQTYTNSEGASPSCGLILSGNNLYGTTTGGGTAGNGTVFTVNTDGTGFRNLHSFSVGDTNDLEETTNIDGAYSDARLVLSGNTLYGTTPLGGTNGNGTIFSITLDSVGPSAPQLSISRSGNRLILTWPTSATGYTLQSTTNLLSPGWTTVTGQFAVTNPISGVRIFYRLSR
jgi:uncharacterized repeat protein (TIGR03803 family)